jgi:hypothetical protein
MDDISNWQVVTWQGIEIDVSDEPSLDYESIRSIGELELRLPRVSKESGISSERLRAVLEFAARALRLAEMEQSGNPSPELSKIRALFRATEDSAWRNVLELCSKAHLEYRWYDVEYFLSTLGMADVTADGQMRLDQLVRFEEETAWPGIASYPSSAYIEYLIHESQASRLSLWQPLMLPLLLQLESYTGWVLHAEFGVPPEMARGIAAVNEDRRDWLLRPKGPQICIYVTEGCLIRMMRHTELSIAQLKSLRTVTSLPQIELRLLADDSKVMAPGQAVAILDIDEVLEKAAFFSPYSSELGFHRDDASLDQASALLRYLDAVALPPQESLDRIVSLLTAATEMSEAAPKRQGEPASPGNDTEPMETTLTSEDLALQAALSPFVKDTPRIRGHGTSWLEVIENGSIWVLLAMLSGVLGNAAYDEARRILEIIQARRTKEPNIPEKQARTLAQHALRARLVVEGKRPPSPEALQCSPGNYNHRSWRFSLRYRNESYNLTIEDSDDPQRILVEIERPLVR